MFTNIKGLFDDCDITGKPFDKCPCEECRAACQLATDLMNDDKFLSGLTSDGYLLIMVVANDS